MRKLDTRKLAREKSLFRYSSALERGDFSAVEVILQEAERDPLLAQMIAEINRVYESELIRLSPLTTSLNHSTNHHQKDVLMTTITLPTPQRSVQRWLPFTLAAACLSMLFIGALMLRPNSNGGLTAGIQAQSSATPTLVPTNLPTFTPTPVPAVDISAGDGTPTPAPAVDGVKPTSVPPAQAGSNYNFTLPMMQAYDFYSQEKFAEAAKVYEQLLSVQPQDAQVLYQYGRVLLELERPKEALAISEQILSNNPQDINGYTLQALAHLKLGDAASALAAATKGYETIDQANSDLLAAMTQTYVQLGRNEEALKYGEAAIRANSSSSDAYRAYAAALASVGKRDEAIQAYENALQYTPNRFSIYRELALQYKATNQMDAALATYERVLALQPDNTKAMVELCQTYSQVGNNESAERYCNNAIAIDPTNAQAYEVRGGVRFRQRNYETAIKDFDQCLALGSLAIECYYQRGLASFYIGDCDTAWSALTGASAFNPDPTIFEIIKSGLKLVTENCANYKDLVIVLNTPVPVTSTVGVPANEFMQTPTPTPAPASVSASAASSGIACESKDVVILSPSSKSVVAGKLDVTGVATGANFGSYRLELIGLATGSKYLTLLNSEQPVVSVGTLGKLDLSPFPPQNYGLRLLVLDTSSQVQAACLVNFTLARTVAAQSTLDAATAIPMYTLPASAVVLTETAALASPAANAPITMTLISGIVVNVDWQSSDGQWLHVNLEGGKNGWVPSTTLQIDLTTVQTNTGTSANSLMTTGFVRVEMADMRDEPNGAATIIKTLPQNTAFGFLQFSADHMWVLAALEDRTVGWVLSSDIVGVTPAETKPAIQCSGTIGQQTAQLFSRPNFAGNAVPIGALEANSFVIILDLDNQAGNPTSWYYVQGLSNPAIVGWVEGNALVITSYCTQSVPQADSGTTTTVQPAVVEAVPDVTTQAEALVPDVSVQLATVIPGDAPVFAGTPTAYFNNVMQGNPPTIMLLEEFAAFPANTEVQVLSAAYDGREWVYQIQSASGATVSLTQDDLIRITAVGQTTTAVAQGMCQAVNEGSDSIPVFSEPNSDGRQSILVNNLAPDVPANLLYRQFNRTTGENWYLVLAILPEGKQISGWVNGDVVALVGDGCPIVQP